MIAFQLKHAHVGSNPDHHWFPSFPLLKQSLFWLGITSTALPSILNAGLLESVAVTGGFTSFSGPASDNYDLGNSGFVYNTFVNSNQLLPTTPSPSSPSEWPALGIGQVTFAAPESSVLFYTNHTTAGVTVDDLVNGVAFTPAPFVSVNVGDEFLLGTFTLWNGTFWAGRGNPEVGFRIETDSASPALDGFAFTDVLEFVMTPNFPGATPEQMADFFFFRGRPDLGSMRIYESPDGVNSGMGTIDLYGKIGSLIPTRLANPTGNVFFDASTPAPRVPDSGSILAIWGLALSSLGIGRGLFLRKI